MANNNTEPSATEVVEKITELRLKFLEKFTDITEDRDVERIRTDDVWLKQFLYARKYNIDHTLTMMETTMKWRKEMEINDVNENNISTEVLEKGSIYFHSCDKENHDILYIRIKDNKKDPEYTKQVKKYIAYLLEVHHTEHKDATIVVLMDATDMGMSNVDMDLLKFQITCFTTYFPCLLEYMLIYEMPWLANAIWKIVKTWLSAEQQKRVLFCKKNGIQEYINKDKLWQHMGGTDDYEYKYIPKTQLTDGDESELESSTPPLAGSPPGGDSLARSSSWSGPSDSVPPGTQKKRVHFNESSILPQSPAVPRGLSRPLLQSSCSGEINFPSTSPGTESRYILTLTNSRSKPVAFKVKTTTPAGYRVRPGSDTVQPGTSSAVEIVCLPAHQEKCSKDRFLLMAAEVEGEDFDMKSVSPEHLFTQRYNVTYGATPKSNSDQPTSQKVNASDQLDKLSQKMDMLVLQQKKNDDAISRLTSTVNQLYYILITLCILVFTAVAYNYFFGATFPEDTCPSNQAEKYVKSAS